MLCSSSPAADRTLIGGGLATGPTGNDIAELEASLRSIQYIPIEVQYSSIEFNCNVSVFYGWYLTVQSKHLTKEMILWWISFQ